MKIIIAADNDQWTEGNPGLTKATEAARKTAALLAVPVFQDITTKPTDFNDFHQLEGLDAVRRCIETAEPLTGKPEEKEPIQDRKQKQPTQSEILLSIALSTLQLFHDQHREPFCYFRNQTLPLKSNK